MKDFDSTQRQVFSLSTNLHACVVGTAGTGKTTLIVEFIQQQLQSGDFKAGEILVLTPQRQAAASISEQIESRYGGILGGHIAVTPAGFAFNLENKQRALEGTREAQLLTGPRQDELVQEAIELLNGEHLTRGEGIQEDVSYRTQIRDIWTALDDNGYSLTDLQHASNSLLAVPQGTTLEARLGQQWSIAAEVLTRVMTLVQQRSPHLFTSSGIQRSVIGRLKNGNVQQLESLPKLILVDQSQDLTEGNLALLAHLANTGTKLWFFGDPDTATSQFQGTLTHVLADHLGELSRAGAVSQVLQGQEQRVLLSTQYRFGNNLQNLLSAITQRIGAGFGWQHRRVATVASEESNVQFAQASTFSQQVGIIAHKLRKTHLEFGGTTEVPWAEMAVVCRSQDEVERFSRALSHCNVPVRYESAGLVLKHSGLVRAMLRLLQHTLGIEPLTAESAFDILQGPLGTLDAVEMRRLRHALLIDERRRARSEDRDVAPLEELILSALTGIVEVPDLAEGRVLKRIARLIHLAEQVHRSGGSSREMLWAIWEHSHLAETLQHAALGQEEPQSANAHAQLDAVHALFFAFERHEEQISAQPVTQLIEEILSSDVPEDTLARQSSRDAVTVTTPRGASYRQYHTVCIVGPQEGLWPNLRPRGALTGATMLVRYLRHGEIEMDNRTVTLHDELRLFACAVSRAQRSLTVVARSDEEEFPSTFFHLGQDHLVTQLPSATLTLSSYTAQMRRRLLRNPGDKEAASTLAQLSRHGVRGANPDHWYGIREASTDEPIVDTRGGEQLVGVSPSQIERAEQCPLDWFLQSISIDRTHPKAQLGTIVHHALEHYTGGGERELMEYIDAQWAGIDTTSEWESAMLYEVAQDMAGGIADYLAQKDHTDSTLVANEARFRVDIGDVRLSGIADRIELIPDPQHPGGVPRILDLKTGSTAINNKAVATNAQLLAYQLGLLRAEFIHQEPEQVGRTTSTSFGVTGGAALLYVNPQAVTSKQRYRLVEQPPLDEESLREFESRLQKIGKLMAGKTFLAEVERHCQEGQFVPACRLHTIPAVSHA